MYLCALSGALLLNVFYVFIMLVPTYQHHSKKAQKTRLKPQAVRARKAALKALKRKLSAP